MTRTTTLSLILAIATLLAIAPARADESKALLEYERNTINVFDKSAASVVFITNKALRRDFFSLDVFAIPQGSGSGFIWDEEGHIVTNFHVIQGASILTVTLADQSIHQAKVIGVEPNKDIAVLKIEVDKGKLTPLPVGSSDRLRVGQKVMAIGNPFGLDQTLTVGIVSALGREITSVTNRKIHNVIQTDAAINPGNSGGPLIDSFGHLVGVNTAIYSPSGTSAGIGFAVPVNTVKRIVPQLIKYGKVIRPGLGVTLVDDSVAKRLRIQGVIIGRAVPDGSAAKAGLKGITRDEHGDLVLGDVITSIKGIKTPNYDAMAYALEQGAVGETIDIEYTRNGRSYRTKVTLQRMN